PGGLQLAYFLGKNSIDYLVLDKADVPGSTFQTFPRHRTLISINKRFTGSDHPEFNMRHDWNSLLCDDDDFRFKLYDKQFFPHADSLVNYIADYAERHRLNVRYNTKISVIQRSGDSYTLQAEDGQKFQCDILIVATGLSRPNVPMIKGIEHTENYADMSLDQDEFENQRVLIIGKKNSAFETAEHIVSNAALIHLCSPKSIRMAWKTHYVGDLRAINNNILDTYQLKSQNAVLDAEVIAIEKQGDKLRVTFRYGHAEGEVEKIEYDRVLCCAGFKFDSSIFAEDTRPALMYNDKYPELKPNFESVNCPNMFFAGTVTHSLDYRKATSGFIHGFRYNSRALANLLLEHYEGVALEKFTIALDAEQITERVLDRVNHSGGLWQQPGFIADVAVHTGSGFTYIKELPKNYITSNTFEGSSDLYVLTLEYGAPIMGDPFAVERIHRKNVDAADASQFLHPVVRRYYNGVLVARHDVIEDLEATWVESEHVEPLKAFFIRQLMNNEPREKYQEKMYSHDTIYHDPVMMHKKAEIKAMEMG
ncbi:MAG: NAD(P)-binding domain-containing protein, partial [Exilibacterium sp.]